MATSDSSDPEERPFKDGSESSRQASSESRARERRGLLRRAPDGKGMWHFGRSGKIWRLDDRTGELLGEVKLPFRLISLIREPGQ